MPVEPASPKAMFEPGALDRTRKNIGNIDPSEAKELTQKLGGEIGVEKSVPQTSRNTAPLAKRVTDPAKKKDAGNSRTTERSGTASSPRTKGISALPKVSKTELAKMDKLMMSDEYRIKMSFGIFTPFVLLLIGNADTVLTAFVRVAMGNTISYMEALRTCIHQLRDAVPESYRKKIEDDGDTKFKMLRKIGSWSLSDIRRQHEALITGTHVTVTMLIPLIKSLYQLLLPVYFLGEQRGSNMLQSILSDIAAYPDVDTGIIAPLIRQMGGDWEYLFKNSARRMYPLLMRMCGTKFHPYPDFFNKEIANILSFLGITKYDLVLPQKNTEAKEDVKASETVTEPANPQSLAESDAQKETSTDDREKKRRFPEAGLNLLDRLFPGAGWPELPNNSAIDLFPYFQPLFNFNDGFALLAPENPVQKIVVLDFILKDLFRGCRSIKFEVDIDSDPRMQSKGDSLALALDEWRVYQDLVFEKRYAVDLKDLVEHLYTREGFIYSPLGKKMIFNLLWQTKFFYLPHFMFLAVGKPQYEFAYRPLCVRVSFLQRIFSVLSERIDAAAKTRAEVAGIRNPWDNCLFDIPNEVSSRLDALARAQKKPVLTTNANIVKTIAAILAVFDWWINDESSPAYAGIENMQVYRTAGGAGSMPVTPPKARSDQNALFQQRLTQIEKAR